MKTKGKHKDFESALARLEEITNKLESGDAPLEESITLYTEGVEIAGFCSQKLNEAEKKIMILKNKNGDLIEAPFGDEADDLEDDEEENAD